MAAMNKVNLNYLKVYCTDKNFSFAVRVNGAKCSNKYDYTFLYIVFLYFPESYD